MTPEQYQNKYFLLTNEEKFYLTPVFDLAAYGGIGPVIETWRTDFPQSDWRDTHLNHEHADNMPILLLSDFLQDTTEWHNYFQHRTYYPELVESMANIYPYQIGEYMPLDLWAVSISSSHYPVHEEGMAEAWAVIQKHRVLAALAMINTFYTNWIYSHIGAYTNAPVTAESIYNWRYIARVLPITYNNLVRRFPTGSTSLFLPVRIRLFPMIFSDDLTVAMERFNYLLVNGKRLAEKILAVDLYGAEMLTELNTFSQASEQRIADFALTAQNREADAQQVADNMVREANLLALQFTVGYSQNLEVQMNQFRILKLTLNQALQDL